MSTILANDRQSVRVNLDKVISYTLITPLEALQLGEFQIPNYLENYSYIEFVIEPYIRFEGLAGEQATMFFYDPSGNALEFKAFKDMDQLFAK